MIDLLLTLVVLLGGVGAAEWVRTTCLRRLHTPVTERRPSDRRSGPQLSR